MNAYRLTPNDDRPLKLLIVELQDKPSIADTGLIELLNRRSIVWWSAVPVVREDDVREKRA